MASVCYQPSVEPTVERLLSQNMMLPPHSYGACATGTSVPMQIATAEIQADAQATCRACTSKSAPAVRNSCSSTAPRKSNSAPSKANKSADAAVSCRSIEPREQSAPYQPVAQTDQLVWYGYRVDGSWTGMSWLAYDLVMWRAQLCESSVTKLVLPV